MPQSCSNCAFGQKTAALADAIATSTAPAAWGTCRATAPTAAGNGPGVFPIVASDDWCGSWLPVARLESVRS